MAEALTLRSELGGYERKTLEEWREVRDNAEVEDLERSGNQLRYEVLDGADRPKDVQQRGYFEDDFRGIRFILTTLEDPTWETVMMAASMHCGGTYDEEAFEEVVKQFGGSQ